MAKPMTTQEIRSDLISKAGYWALGAPYWDLRTICESQKTVSTARLTVLLDQYEQRARAHALELKRLADELSK